MEPLTPNDPIWKLLGNARPVEPRSNFTQNVMRAVRGEAQKTGWIFALRDWMIEWQRPALVGVAACAMLMLSAVTWFMQPEDFNRPTAVAAQSTQLDEDLALIANDPGMPLDGLDHMDALLAMEDISALTDKEIAFLLY